MRLVTLSLTRIDAAMRADPEANRLFLAILTSRNAPEIVLRLMNQAGVLGRFIPDFGRIVALMQFNMYHSYTVDEHLIRAVGILAEIESGRGAIEHKLAQEVLPTLQDRRVLYVALFLHDIAKGRIEDHSLAGTGVARKLCPRLGLGPREDGDRRLADRESPRDVGHGAAARPLRPPHDRDLFRARRHARPAQHAVYPHGLRHPRGRPRRVEQLEGGAAARALPRDREHHRRRAI